MPREKDAAGVVFERGSRTANPAACLVDLGRSTHVVDVEATSTIYMLQPLCQPQRAVHFVRLVNDLRLEALRQRSERRPPVDPPWSAPGLARTDFVHEERG
jgi:hypothetical protein